ncbi:hypothetical protein F5Y03DRAFT_407296 [Xylaria venustula]|nr:hypothetical protein F5Y03DRAFT_407296 [Xylaria venustula]
MDEYLSEDMNRGATQSPDSSIHFYDISDRIIRPNQENDRGYQPNPPDIFTNYRPSNVCSNPPRTQPATTTTSPQSQTFFIPPPHRPHRPHFTTTKMDPGIPAPSPAPTTAAPAPPPTPAPPRSIPTAPATPQHPNSSAHPGTNASAHPSQHSAQPPPQPALGPWGHPPYPPPNAGVGAPFAMAAPNGWHQPFHYPPLHMQQAQQQQQYWYYYPGTFPGANLPMTYTQQSPWWSGTSHYRSNPPLQAPQVYTVEPAWIGSQAMYYQATVPAPNAAPVYYYATGAPAYYYC